MIPILFRIDKTVLRKHVKDMAQWLIYLTIDNLSHESQRSQVRPEGMMVGFIVIHKSDLFDVKMEIY